MMKRTSSMRPHFSWLALAIASAISLTGCPNPGPSTSADPEASPSPSPSASQNPNEEQPPNEIKTLGLVKAEIKATSFTLRLATDLVTFWEVGTLAAKEGVPPQGAQFFWKATRVDMPGGFELSHSGYYSHTFVPLPVEEAYQKVGLTMGGQTPSLRVREGDIVRVKFPAGAEGPLMMTLPAESGLQIKTERRTNNESAALYFLIDESPSFSTKQLESMATHDATASLTVSVAELTGAPSTGLTAGHFSVSAANVKPGLPAFKGKVAAATETQPGRYALTVTFEGLSGHGATARKLTLQVGNPTLRTEVTP